MKNLDQNGRSPFGKWFYDLDAQAAAKVKTARARLSLGNWSNAKSVGDGVHEYVIDFGPGYRVYFGKDGNTLVILLGGGTRNGRAQTLTPPKTDGRTTNRARRWRNENGTYKKFRRDTESKSRA